MNPTYRKIRPWFTVTLLASSSTAAVLRSRLQTALDEFKSRKAEALLTANDYLHLKKMVEMIATNLSEIQRKALFDIEAVLGLAAKDPSALAPPGPYAE